MTLNNHDSDSKTQRDKEGEIIKEVFKTFYPDENLSVDNNQEKSFNISESDKIKMQFDLFLSEQKVIGEVYVTELPLNPGRKRKVMTDLLKMITFERFKQNESTVSFQKLYFLTITEEQASKFDESTENKTFIKHSREHSLIGKDSWINVTLEEFGIELYYYVITNDFLNVLNSTRKKQTEGMKKYN